MVFKVMLISPERKARWGFDQSRLTRHPWILVRRGDWPWADLDALPQGRL